jgi:hypothetical protein
MAPQCEEHRPRTKSRGSGKKTAPVTYLGSQSTPDLHWATRLIAVVFSEPTFTIFNTARPFFLCPISLRFETRAQV